MWLEGPRQVETTRSVFRCITGFSDFPANVFRSLSLGLSISGHKDYIANLQRQYDDNTQILVTLSGMFPPFRYSHLVLCESCGTRRARNLGTLLKSLQEKLFLYCRCRIHRHVLGCELQYCIFIRDEAAQSSVLSCFLHALLADILFIWTILL